MSRLWVGAVSFAVLLGTLTAIPANAADGTKATVEQMSHDVSAFLMWAAEPKLEDRKRMGFKVMVFLIVLTGLFFMAKKRIWAKLH